MKNDDDTPWGRILNDENAGFDAILLAVGTTLIAVIAALLKL